MDWLEKSHGGCRTKFDSEVIISVENRRDTKMLLFRFRKNSIYKIISSTDYIVLAKDNNKIYFKESSDTKGFKVGDYSQFIKSFKIQFDRLPLREEDLGEYNLEYDTNLHLHYICLNRKLEKQLDWEVK